MRLVKYSEWEAHDFRKRFKSGVRPETTKYWVNTPLPRLPNDSPGDDPVNPLPFMLRMEADRLSLSKLMEVYQTCCYGNQRPTAIRCTAHTWARMLYEFSVRMSPKALEDSLHITLDGKRAIDFSFEGCPFVIAPEFLKYSELFFLNELEWDGDPRLHAILTIKEWQ